MNRIFQQLLQTRSLWIGYIIVAALMNAPRAQAVSVNIDTTQRYQTIEGFGTCSYIYDSGTETNYTTTAFQNMYAQDLGCSIMRMEINPDVEVAEDTDLTNLDLNNLNFSAPSTTVNGPLMSAINSKKLDRFLVYATVWSPPAWMKDNDATINGGHLLAADRYYYGKYLAAYCIKFQQTYGVPIYALSIQNELEFSESYNSCVYSPQQLEAAIIAVQAEFTQWGVTTKIESPEDLGGSQYWADRSLSYIYQFQSDPIAGPDVSVFNIHGYSNAATTQAGGAPSASVYFHGKIQGYNKEMWQTETSGENPNWTDINSNGVQDGSETVASELHSVLTDGYGSAWLYWQICDDTADAFSLTDNTDNESTPKYCAAKHYFRYIRPGSVRVADSGSTATFLTSAYVNDANKSLTIVMQNMDTNSVSVTATVPSYPSISSYQCWESSSTLHFAAQSAVTPNGGQFTLVLPPQSLFTLYGTGTGTAPTVPTPPTNLIGIGENGYINLSWTAAWSATSYTLSRSTTSGSGYSALATGLGATSYVDNNVVNGTTYYYVVTGINTSGASSNSAQATVIPKTGNAAYTTTAPVIDGNVDSVWSGATQYPISNIATGPLTNNLGGTYQMLWDATNLYMLVTVTDSSPAAADDVEVYFDNNNSKIYYYDAGDSQYSFGWDGTTIGGEKRNTTGVQYATGSMSGGYRIEILWPLSTLGIAPFSNNAFGLDVMVSDAGGSKIGWFNTVDDDWMFPLNFGNGLLSAGSGLPSAPGIPGGISTTVADSQVNLSWSSVSGASGYEIKRSTTSGGPYLSTGFTTTTSFADLGLYDGTTYYYVISAYNLGGQSGNSSQVSAIPQTPTPAPGTVQINCGGPAITTWLADTDFSGGSATQNYTGPVVRTILNPAPEAVYQTTHDGSSTYTITGLTANAAYTVRLHFDETYWDAVGSRTFNVSINGTQVLTSFDIFADAGGQYVADIKQFSTNADSSGNVTIIFTTVVNNASVAGIEVIPSGSSAPAAPTGLAAVAGNAQVALSWNASTGATSYNVYCGTTAGGEAGTAIATGVTVTSYTNTGLTNGTTYYYKVTAVNSVGTSGYSNEASATPTAGTAPPAPTGLTAAASNGQVALSWTASSGATSYNVYRGTTAGGEAATAIATGITVTTYANTGLTDGTTYYFKVAALNSFGTSGMSNEASATPQVSVPPAPTGLTATPGNAQVALGWTASSGATSYNVYRGTSAGGESATAIATGLTVTNYTNTGLTNGATYYYKVAAVNAAGTSGMSNEASAIPTSSTSTPYITGQTLGTLRNTEEWDGFNFTVGSTAITVTALGVWVVSGNSNTHTVKLVNGSGTDITGGSVSVNMSGQPGGAYAYTSLNSPITLTANTSYYIVVQEGVGGDSWYSDDTSVTATNVATMDYSVWYDTSYHNDRPGNQTYGPINFKYQVGGGSAPPAPTGLTATPGNAQVALGWTASSGATSYNVYRGTTAGGESATAIATGITTTVYTNSGLTNGTTYYYKVAAVNTIGTSGMSNEASAAPVGSPAAPTGLAATGGNAQVALTWTGSTGATSYNVYRGTTTGGESATAIVTGVTVTNYTNTSLTNGTTYYYKVAAVNGGGTSGMSNEASASPNTGSLAGSVTSSSSGVNLTTLGATDWAHWGDGGVPGSNRDSNGSSQISAYTEVGSGTVGDYTNDPRQISWTNGTPTGSSTSNEDGVYLSNTGNGFSFTVPAGTASHTVYVYVGGFNSAGTLTAHLSDGSASNYTNTTSLASGQYDANYTLTYHAATAGQTLTLTWVMASGTGNVTLNGVALQ